MHLEPTIQSLPLSVRLRRAPASSACGVTARGGSRVPVTSAVVAGSWSSVAGNVRGPGPTHNRRGRVPAATPRACLAMVRPVPAARAARPRQPSPRPAPSARARVRSISPARNVAAVSPVKPAARPATGRGFIDESPERPGPPLTVFIGVHQLWSVFIGVPIFFAFPIGPLRMVDLASLPIHAARVAPALDDVHDALADVGCHHP